MERGTQCPGGLVNAWPCPDGPGGEGVARGLSSEGVELNLRVPGQVRPPHPAPVDAVLPAGFNEWPGCGGDGLLVQGTADGCVQSVTFGEVVQQLLQHGGRGGASRGEVPQAVRDGRLVRSYDPGGLVGGASWMRSMRRVWDSWMAWVVSSDQVRHFD